MIVLTKNNIKSICRKWFNVSVTDQQTTLIDKEVKKYLDIMGDDIISESTLAEIIGDVIL